MSATRWRGTPRWQAHASLALLLALAYSTLAWAQVAPGPGPITGVASVGMTVTDMDRSVAFYSGVLSFEKVSDVEVSGEDYEHLQGVFGARMRVVRLRLGQEFIELTEYLAPRGRPIPVDSRSNDRWFQHIAIVVSDIDRAYASLRQNKVAQISPGPQRLPDWNPNAGGIRAFYFRDPDGHALELIQFPEGKGNPRWHGTGGSLFLGIDHTAIAVGNTDASVGLYRGVLGLRVVGESENYGPEQERLNNIFGTRLRITALRAPEGPGVELLEYLAPPGGRAAPTDSRANDVWHWQTLLTTTDAEAVARIARAHTVALVSPGVVRLPGKELGFRAGILVRDPDAHAILVTQP